MIFDVLGRKSWWPRGKLVLNMISCQDGFRVGPMLVVLWYFTGTRDMAGDFFKSAGLAVQNSQLQTSSSGIKLLFRRKKKIRADLT